MSREERLEQFEDIEKTILDDKELTLRILCEMYGDHKGLWYIIHDHVTGLYDERNLDDDQVEREVENTVYAFREIMDQIVEEEIL